MNRLRQAGRVMEAEKVKARSRKVVGSGQWAVEKAANRAVFPLPFYSLSRSNQFLSAHCPLPTGHWPLLSAHCPVRRLRNNELMRDRTDPTIDRRMRLPTAIPDAVTSARIAANELVLCP